MKYFANERKDAAARAAAAAFPLHWSAAAGRLVLAAALALAWWQDMQPYLGSASPARLLLILSLLLIPVSAYFFVLTRRFTGTVLAGRGETAQELAALLLSAAALVPSMHIFGLPVLLVLHVVIIGLLMEILYGVTARLGRRRPRWWRILYRSSVIPLAGAALLTGYGFWNMKSPVSAEYTVASEKALPPGGYKAVLFTDLHYGNALHSAELRQDAAAIAAEAPDLVLLGGDIVDERTSERDMKEAFRILGSIPARYGVYYVYGNHDKALYTAQPAFTPEELAQAIEDAGITILEDQTVTAAPGLTVTGRQDRSDPMRTGVPRVSSEALAEGLDPAAFHILLDHQPRYFEENAAAGYDLMLSGHTHAGQIWPAGLLIGALDAGTIVYGHEVRDGMDVIVSSGISGWGYPLRTEGQSEYVTIHITGKGEGT